MCTTFKKFVATEEFAPIYATKAILMYTIIVKWKLFSNENIALSSLVMCNLSYPDILGFEIAVRNLA